MSHITIVDDDEISQFRITIPAQSNWFVIFVLSLCLYGWASLEVVIPTSLIAGLSSGQGKWAGVSGLFLLLIGFPVMTICGLVMVLALCWNLAGREVVTLSLGALGLTREIGVFRRSLRFDLAGVRNLRAAPPLTYNPFSITGSCRLQLQFVGLGGGAVAFDHGGKTYSFGNGLTDSEATRLVATIRQRCKIPDDRDEAKRASDEL